MTTDVCPSAFLYQLPDPVQAPLVAIVRELTGMDEEEKRTTGALPYLDPLEVRSESVQVQLDDGRWVDGWLEAQRKVEGVWSGYVLYTPAPAETYLGVVRGGAYQEGVYGQPAAR